MLRSFAICGDNNRSDLYSKYQCQERKSSASSTASTSSTGSTQNFCTKFTQMSRQVLADAFEKNWHENFGNETGYDDSLTNLNWLHNVNPIKINEQLSLPQLVGYPKDTSNNFSYAGRSSQSYANQVQQWPHILGTNTAGSSQELPSSSFSQPDFKNNPNLKPPFAYSILISWAMRDLRKSKITLSDIYSWIIENFAYYRHADSSWQNSVRHNLSLGKCFEKVPRRKDEPGKGGFWRINPQHSRTLDINLSKIKYNPSGQPIQNIRTDNTFNQPKLPTQMSTPSETMYSNNAAPTPVVKRSRKSPITVTHEEFDIQDIYNVDSITAFDNNGHNTFQNSNPVTFDLSPFDTSSSDSNHFCAPSSDQDISLSSFNSDSHLEYALNSPMLLDKEDFIDHDDFRLLSSNNDFSDFFFQSKDDLQDLDYFLGIY